MGKPKLIAIVGPTASGKSALGIYIAQKLKGEVISADSRQVYKGLDIGTGKVTKKEMLGVPHHLLSVVSPKKQFTVDDFVRLADKAYASVLQNNAVAIVVGGTGLYVDMLVGRMSYPNVPPNEALRKKLANKTALQLFAMLKKADPARAANIEASNPRRLIRALEIAKAIGKSPTPNPEPKYDVLWLGLNPDQKKLQRNIHKRLLSRIKAGMINEAKRLRKQGLTYKRMDELGLEYRYLAQLLQNKLTKKEFAEQLERAINDYAKRQMRWFKRNQDIVWAGSKTEALKLAKDFLRAMLESNQQ
ncbi:MAG TPA: tRNA (adenosine(37)-N6)-dimethylallyltransferase MiaA [Candidatus Paceibacterota bacterium]|nr:tRNA (adenosine(37)-N6)-dimethylallyltransferase MiaA [Candidatus Paceibacterota bacterium]